MVNPSPYGAGLPSNRPLELVKLERIHKVTGFLGYASGSLAVTSWCTHNIYITFSTLIFLIGRNFIIVIYTTIIIVNLLFLLYIYIYILLLSC